MAGYSGWSMSNNAVDAYSNGEKPLSKWTKADIFDTIEEQEIELKCSMEKFKKLPVKVLKEVCLRYSSWHHTSNHYNQTDFYSLDISRIENLTEGIVKGDWFYRKNGTKKKTTANGFEFIKKLEE